MYQNIMRTGAVLLGVGLSLPAHALPVQRDICVWYQLDLVDADPIHGDDYVVDNTQSYRASYALIRLHDETAGTFESIWVEEDGCVTRTLDTAHSYYVALKSQADVDGRRIRVHTSTNFDFPYMVIGPSFQPGSHGPATYNVTFDAATIGSWINVLAISSWTIHRRKADWPLLPAGDTYKIYMSGASNGYAAFHASEEAVFLENGTNAPDRKFVVAHELGHALQYWTNWLTLEAIYGASWSDCSDCARSKFDYSAPKDSDCGDEYDSATGQHGHRMTTKEYQAAAAVEGFAYYVAALAFNDVTGPDCRYTGISVEWTPGTELYYDDAFSCEGAEDNDPGGFESTILFPVDARDYLGDWCNAGVMENRGTDLDWLRFWWDVDQDQGVTFGDIVDVWALAGSYDWTPGARDTSDTGYDILDDPAIRILHAFDAHGIQGAWWAEASNGIAR